MKGGPRRGWQFRGLALRVGGIVFGASLLALLAITWVSVRSVDRFLRERVERRFPEILDTAGGRLELWYRQRETDILTFAGSEIVTESLERPGAPARAELENYLAYVLEQFPQYAALVALDLSGGERLWVGERRTLRSPARAELKAPAVGPLQGEGDGRFQLVSAPVPGGRGTLHAILPIAAVEAAVDAEAARAGAELGLLDGGGTPLAGALRIADAASQAAGPGAPPLFTVGPDGERVIASLRPFGRFGWSLVVQEDYDAAFAPVADAVRAALLPSLLAVVLASAGAFVLGAWGVRPLLALAEAARRLADGDGAVSVPDTGTMGEVRTLARAFNHMALRLHENRVELEARNSELETANEVLEQLSITDGLTKLHNHRYFQDQYAREARRAQRTGASLSLVLIDIDCFKPLNDELGHAAGDQVLARVAQVMSMEIRETDTLARYGGEEFALIAPATELEGAIALAEKIRGAVAAHEFPVYGPEGPVRITVSLGVAVFDGDASHTFHRADAALYEAKSGGRDCVRWSGGDEGAPAEPTPA